MWHAVDGPVDFLFIIRSLEPTVSKCLRLARAINDEPEVGAQARWWGFSLSELRVSLAKSIARRGHGYQ